MATEEVLANGVSEKTLSYDLEYDGATAAASDVWTYQRGAASASMTAPNGSTTTEYYGSGNPAIFAPGEVYKIESGDGSVIERVYASNAPGVSSVAGYPNSLYKANRYVKYEFTSIAAAAGNPAKTAIKEYCRDKNGNVTEVREYDFVPYSGTGSVPRDSNGRPTGPPTGATPLRISKTEYYNNTPDATVATYTDTDIYTQSTSPRLLNLARSSEVQDGSGTPKSRSEMTYDFTGYSGNTVGGNLIESKAWDSYKGGAARAYSNPLTSTNSVSTSATYNAYGMPLTSMDANEVESRITYGIVAGPSGNVTDLYPTQTVLAYGTSIARTSSAVYDFYTGLATASTDNDNGVTNATEFDPLGRPVKSITAQGTLLESWTQTEYHDADRFVVVRSDLETKDDRRKVATQFYDQLGRVRLSKTLEDAATQNPYNDMDGIKVQTRYAYDDPTPTVSTDPQNSLGTFSLVSNPYRAATSAAASTEPTMGWTRSKTVNTGRHSEVETFSGASLPAPWGASTASTGVVQTDTDANAATVTDQAGKLRRSITNGIGQLVRVDEPNGSNALGSVTSPNQYTSYAYDTLNNLIAVGQGVQTRSFSYSSLSRLLSAANPESGTLNYVYDNNGNLIGKTDARTITTAYAYDALNRVLQRSYSGESGYTTPNVTYTYDGQTHAKGKLTKVSSSASTTEYTSFDILGRVTGHKQSTDGTDYTTGYIYNLSGAMVEETYPSGRVVKNDLDNNGDLSMVESRKNAASGYWSYANSFTYNSAGAVTSMQLGNGRWESTTFNNRLQPTQIALGTTQNATDTLKLNYSYGTTANDGNVQSQTITAPTVGTNTGFAAVQTYTYDELNRLEDATENVTPTGGTASQSWKQTFTYDRYGNRNFDEAATTTLPKDCGTSPSFTVCAADRKVVNPGFNTPNDNRLSTADGYAYDTSGNLKSDPQLRKFTYDAENKQTKVETVNSGGTVTGTVGEYTYDGDGKRVKKKGYTSGVLTEETVFVYDAGGKLVAEYSNQVANSPDAKVAYLTNDHLGSPRINTDADGKVISRHDYHPFGEEIISSRTHAEYAGDSVRKQFTGYERDNESSLDFAQARMYANRIGGFTTPDVVAGEISNPQTLNRYAYVWNNPMILTDPSGMTVSWEDSKKKTKKGETEERTDAQRGYENHLEGMINSDDKKTREKGLKLKAEYERLQKSDITFHVRSQVADESSGELSYEGQKGHLYVNIKGDSSAFGSLTITQKLAHEFKHGAQFLDGELGFYRQGGEWKSGFANDLFDESEAMTAGFDAEPISGFQKSDRIQSHPFMRALDAALQNGQEAVIGVMKTHAMSPYRTYNTERQTIRGKLISENYYALPKK